MLGAAFTYRGREFVRGVVPSGINQGMTFTVARRLAERYEVQKFFASGGCGLLLEGHDLRTGTSVLIKTTLRYDVIEYVRGHDEDGLTKQLIGPRKQLQTERRIMVLLKNSGCNSIPNPNDYIFDWNPWLETSGGDGSWKYLDENMLSSEPYLIMERMDGHTLSNELMVPLAEARTLAIMGQVAHVLAALHQPISRGKDEWRLVYQDLKPDNIMIGQEDSVSLLDLGGCRLTLGGPAAGRVGLKGASTPGYCAPECQGADPLTPSVDCYTVASTMFHMLTGHSPTKFLGATAATNGPQFVSFERWDWAALEGRVSHATCAFLRRCLAHKPSERPRDGAALVSEIALLRKG